MATLPALIETPPCDEGLLRAMAKAFRVPERMLLSDWAEKYRILPQEEAKPGPFRVANSPWSKEIMDRLSPMDPCTIVVMMKSTQVSATETGNNWVGQMIDQYPGRFLHVQPTVELAKRHVRTRINRLIDSTPSVKSKVAAPNSREGTNTLLEKEFLNGMFVATGANSEVGLRSIAAPYIHFDECDAYPLDVEGAGDPCELAKRRADTFGHRRKFFFSSTPLDEDISRIEPLYEDSDKNKFYVPCPHCDFQQFLSWANVKYDKSRPQEAQYFCPNCSAAWTESQRIHATRAGVWIPEREWLPHMPRGYFINALYSHSVSIGELAMEWVAAQNNIEKLISFINTRLGETWKDQSVYSYEPDKLLARREVYDFPCPTGVQLITAGVDVQDDRLEILVAGWGYGEECWSLGYHILYGRTSEWDVWHELTELLKKTYHSPYGKQFISAVAIDSGNGTNMIYNYCLERDNTRTRRVWPIKGAAGNYGPMWGRKPLRNRTSKLTPYMVNVYEIKRAIFARLHNDPGGAGTFHFPEDDSHDKGYFDQLAGQSLKTIRKNGRTQKAWVDRRGVRHEVLDCMVYAFGAMKGMVKVGFGFLMPNELPEPIAPQLEAATQVLAEPPVPHRPAVEQPPAETPAEKLGTTPPSAKEHASPTSPPPGQRRRPRPRRFSFRR